MSIPNFGENLPSADKVVAALQGMQTKFDTKGDEIWAEPYPKGFHKLSPEEKDAFRSYKKSGGQHKLRAEATKRALERFQPIKSDEAGQPLPRTTEEVLKELYNTFRLTAEGAATMADRATETGDTSVESVWDRQVVGESAVFARLGAELIGLACAEIRESEKNTPQVPTIPQNQA